MGLQNPQNIQAEFNAAVAQLLRNDNIGQWASDHGQEAKAYSGWNYLAIAALGREAARAHAYAYKDGTERGQALRKSLRAQHGHMWKSMAQQDGSADLASENSWVAQLITNPNGTSTGSMFRWEYIQQMHLHGCCIIFNRPTVDGKRTAARYVVPMALTQPVYPGQDPKCPEGGIKILPYQAGLGWYVNPLIGHLSGATISSHALSVIRYPNPLLKGDGKSPSDAAGWWIDTAAMVDIARWKQLKRGPRPHGIVMIDGEEVDDKTLERLERRLNEKLSEREYDERIIAVNAKGDFSTDFSPHDMDYVGSFEQIGQSILAVHGASKAMVGLTDNMTYGSLAAALRQGGAVVQSDLDLLAADFTAHVQSQGALESVEFEVQPVDDPELIETQLTTDLQAGVRTMREWRAIRGLPPFGDWRDEARVTSTGLIVDPAEPPGQSSASSMQSSFLPRSMMKSMAKAEVPGPAPEQPIVAVDLDGTLAEYHGYDPDFIGNPIPAIVERVNALKAAGCLIAIFTCRDDEELISRWLEDNNVPFDAINDTPGVAAANSDSGKIFAHAYLDDRGVNVEEGVRAIAKLLPEGPVKQRLLKESRDEGPGCIVLHGGASVREAAEIERDKIDPGVLVGDGCEPDPHVTLLYGVVGVDIEEVVDAVRRLQQVDVVFGPTSLFSNAKEDVVKIDVESPKLHQYRDKLLSLLPVVEQTHPTYQPHLTLAYVAPNEGKAYEGKNSLTGKSSTLTHATVSLKGVRIEVPLRQPS